MINENTFVHKGFTSGVVSITNASGITPVGRMGGKSKIAKYLIKMFPEFDTYVEPFLGAGNVFLRIPKDKLVGKETILNDIDSDMYTIFSELKNRPKWVNENVHRFWLTKEEFNQIKMNTDVLSLIALAKNSFYGLCKSYSPRKLDNRKGRKPNAGPTTNYENIGQKLKNSIILNTSFEKLIQEYDNAGTFFYLDPPYEISSENGYKDYVTPNEVYNALQGLKGKFMLSYNDSPNIRKIFAAYTIRTIDNIYMGSTTIDRRQKKELIITNY